MSRIDDVLSDIEKKRNANKGKRYAPGAPEAVAAATNARTVPTTTRAQATNDILRNTATEMEQQRTVPTMETSYAYAPNAQTRKAAHYADTANRLREISAETRRSAPLLQQIGERIINRAAEGAGYDYETTAEKARNISRRADAYDELSRAAYGKYYHDLRNRDDFAEKSKAGEAKSGGVMSGGYYDDQGNLRNLMTEEVMGDARYDFINDINGYREQVKQYQAAQDQDYAAGTEARMGKADPYSVFSPYIFMRDDEIATYNYLYETEGKGSADKYIDRLTPELNGRWRTAQEGRMTLFAYQDPVGASAYSVAMSPTRSLNYLGQVRDLIDDGEIDQNARYNRFSQSNTAIRSKVSETVGEKYGPVGSFAYNLGMSMADSALNTIPTIVATGGGAAAAPIIEWAMLGIMGSGVAADTVVSMKDQGASDAKAFILGTAAGAVEAITEKIGVDAFLESLTKGIAGKSLVPALLKMAAQNGGSEAAEEGLADIFNWFADDIYAVISGGESEFASLVDYYRAQGMTDGEAVGKAFGDRAKEIGLDVIGGGISGLLFGGGALAANLAAGRTGGQQTGTEITPEQTLMSIAAQQMRDADFERAANSLAPNEQTQESAAPRNLPEGITPEQAAMYEAAQSMREQDFRQTGETLRQTAQEMYGVDEADAQRHGNAPEMAATASTEAAHHIDNRSMESMGDRKVKAFSFEHPELHNHFAQAAQTLIQDAGFSSENSGWTYSRQRDMRGKVGRIYKRQESSLLKAAREEGYSIPEIIDAAKRIINDQGQENTAAAKRLEIILDDMLTNGYTTSYGENIAPNSEYISAKASLPGGSSEADIRIRQARERWDYIDSLEGPADEAELAERVAEIERIRGGRADAAATDIAPETQSGKQEPGAALIGYAREAFDRGETGLSTALTEFYTDSVTDEAGFIGDMTRAYNAGVQGVPFERARVESDAATEPARRAAYLEGVADAKRSDASRRSGASKSTAAEAQNSGLVRDDLFAKARLTDKEARILDALAKVLGVEIRFVDRLNATDENGKQSGANAQYLDGVISLSLDSEDPLVTAAVHETVHRVKEMSPEAYDMLERFVRNKMRQGAWDINAEIRRGVYAEEEIPEEIVADGFGRMLRDEDLASEFAEDNRTAWQKFIDTLRDILTEIRRFVSGNRKTLSRDQLLAYRDLENHVDSMLTLYTQAVKEAGENAAATTRSSEENGKSAKFSMRLPVEETDRFIALHNMNADAVRGALELGGLAMPSIALTRADAGHNTYGDISVVFGKDSVSPTDRRNKIWSGDAYTPSFPEVGYKISKKASDRIRNKIDILLEEAGVPKGELRPSFDTDNGQDKIRRWSSFAEAYKGDDGMKIAFLKDTGKAIVVPMMEKRYTDMADLRTLRAINKNFPIAEIMNQGSQEVMKYEPEVRRYVRDYALKTYGQDLADKLYPADKALSFNDVDRVFMAASKFAHSGETKQIDTKKLDKRIENAMRGKKIQAEYMDWLNRLGEGFVEKKGIRNERDYFTPLGNRRSFEQLYYDYSLANIVKAMQQQVQQGKATFLTGSGNIRGAAAKSYGSIEEARQDIGRIRNMGISETENAEIQAFDDKCLDLCTRMVEGRGHNKYMGAIDAAEVLTETLAKYKTEDAIYRYLKREYEGYYNVTKEIAHDAAELVKEAQQLPTSYLEAKPYRAVPLDEPLAWVVPSNEKELIQQMRDEGLNVLTYKPDDNADRLAKVNSVEGARFSKPQRELTAEDRAYLSAVQSGDMETAQRMVDEAAKAAGYIIEAYHGTDQEFTVFDGGAYFTDDYFNADGYAHGERVIDAYLKLENPLIINANGAKWDELDSKYGSSTREITWRLDGKHDGVVFNDIADSWADDADAGIFTVYYIKDSSQAKSADPITYDDAGNIIPLSERFNPEKKDIRYSKGTDAEKLRELIKQYGAMEPGERPAREVQVPRRTAPGNKVSQTVRTVMEAEATPESILPDIEQLTAEDKFTYTPYSDEAAIKNAEEIIGQSWNTALNRWMLEVGKGNVSKTNTALGWALYNNAANRGDTETALNVLQAIIKHQRNAAQAVQATRILKQLNPETQLYGVVKTVEGLTRELQERFKKEVPELKVDESLAEAFIRAQSQEERDRIMRQIYVDVGRQMPTTFLDRWNAWRYLAMLGNPRTHVRNLAGNAGFAPVVATKDLLATGIEAAVNAVSGGKLNRTKGNLVGKRGKALLAAAWNDYKTPGVRERALGQQKYNDRAISNKAVEEGRRIFGVTGFAPWDATGGKALETARRANSSLLDREDMWFSRPHYAFALAQYCAANNITPEDIKSGKGIAAAREYAYREAQRATYRDANALSQAVSRLGRGGGKKTGLQKAISAAAEGILPFRATPANILVRGLQYSPLGLMKAIAYDTYQLKQGNITGADMIDDISAGLTGTGLVALGVFLAAHGLLRGRGDDDEKKKDFEKLTGHQDYALELPGGTSVTLDWMAPEALPVFVGANLWETALEREEGLKMEDVLSAAGNVTEPMLEMSMLKSLNDLFDDVSYAVQGKKSVNALTSAAAAAATSYLTQGLPTLLGQFERTGEDKRMTTYTDKNGFLTGDIQYTVGKASARVPVWEYSQIPYIDAWGREELTGNLLKRGLNNFINPAYTSKVDESAMEKELLRLYDKTGDNVFPQRAEKYFTSEGVKKDLTAEEYVTFATAQGTVAYTVVGNMVKDPMYKALDDDNKAAVIKDAYAYAQQTAKTKVGGTVATSYKWVEDAMTANKKYNIPPEQYILVNHTVSDIKSIKDKDGKTITNSQGLQRMQYIYGIKGLTDEQRQFLFDVADVGKTIIHYNKAKVDEELAKIKNK